MAEVFVMFSTAWVGSRHCKGRATAQRPLDAPGPAARGQAAELKNRRAGQLTNHLVVLFAVCAAPATVLHRRGLKTSVALAKFFYTKRKNYKPCKTNMA